MKTRKVPLSPVCCSITLKPTRIWGDLIFLNTIFWIGSGRRLIISQLTLDCLHCETLLPDCLRKPSTSLFTVTHFCLNCNVIPATNHLFIMFLLDCYELMPEMCQKRLRWFICGILRGLLFCASNSYSCFQSDHYSMSLCPCTLFGQSR